MAFRVNRWKTVVKKNRPGSMGWAEFNSPTPFRTAFRRRRKLLNTPTVRVFSRSRRKKPLSRQNESASVRRILRLFFLRRRPLTLALKYDGRPCRFYVYSLLFPGRPVETVFSERGMRSSAIGRRRLVPAVRHRPR